MPSVVSWSTDPGLFDLVKTRLHTPVVGDILDWMGFTRQFLPHHRGTFIDEGDIDMPRKLRVLRDTGFDGVLIPAHAPAMTCAAPWRAGMAYACGWMKAALAITAGGPN